MSHAAQALCRSCGFCCDGTLFSVVPLATAPPAGESVSLRVLTRPDGSQVIEQPCGALQAEGCAIYSERPSPCRDYRCNLLIALEEGEVSLEEAKELVGRVQALAGRLDAALPVPATPAPLRHRMRDAVLSPDLEHDARRWEALLVQHFRGRRG